MPTTKSTTALAETDATAQRGITSFTQVRDLTGYDLTQIAMIRHNMASSMGKKPDEVPLYDVALFCHSSKALGLDPLLKQAYWISRDGKGTLQVGIDGFRAIADRSNTYAGSEPPIFRGQRSDGMPEMASVVVWKIVAGHKCAFTGEARWAEFYPGEKQGFMWRKMPYHMLGKCAEGQALRKAFPAQLGSVALAAEVGEEVPHHVEVIEQQRRALLTAADYDRTIGASDWGEKQPTPQPPSEHTQKHAHLRKLIAEAKSLGLEAGALPPTDPDEDPVDVAIAYWESRIDNFKKDQQLVKESAQQEAF